MTGPEALADRLEEAALASLPFGSGELALALAEANAVRRGEEPWGDVTVSDMKVALAEWSGGRDARIARAAEAFVASQRDLTKPGQEEAWDRLVEAVEGGANQEVAEATDEEEAIRRDERARIRQRMLDEAALQERVAKQLDLHGIDEGHEDSAQALRDFAALLAPPAPAEGGGE